MQVLIQFSCSIGPLWRSRFAQCRLSKAIGLFPATLVVQHYRYCFTAAAVIFHVGGQLWRTPALYTYLGILNVLIIAGVAKLSRLGVATATTQLLQDILTALCIDHLGCLDCINPLSLWIKFLDSRCYRWRLCCYMSKSKLYFLFCSVLAGRAWFYR